MLPGGRWILVQTPGPGTSGLSRTQRIEIGIARTRVRVGWRISFSSLTLSTCPLKSARKVVSPATSGGIKVSASLVQIPKHGPQKLGERSTRKKGLR